MIDLGLLDLKHKVGFAVDPAVYDLLQRAGQVARSQPRRRRDASGHWSVTVAGIVTAQLIDPATQQRIGPVVRLHALRGVPGVPSWVGVVFFHRLHGCRVLWELNSRTWCVEYP
jgi:hypothetical protein